MKAGFVTILGYPNAGKSTLINTILGEKLSIVSPKVQTTRHRIKGFLTKSKEYQMVFSDTPGILEAKYKLHESMMNAVKKSIEDADIILFIWDAQEKLEHFNSSILSIPKKIPLVLVLNKVDLVSSEKQKDLISFFTTKNIFTEIIPISALFATAIPTLLTTCIKLLPESEMFYPEDEFTDRSVRFYIEERIREKLFLLFEQEIPYHSTVLVNVYQEKTTLTKIQADIIVMRETQKGIILGKDGSKIKQLGTEARKDIEAWIGRQIFLELKVKVRPNWRSNDMLLKSYGY